MTNPLENPFGTAFGLMDDVYGPGSAKALMECGGPWEWFTGHHWNDGDPNWFGNVIYRKKPEPPKPAWPEEVWVNVDADRCWQAYETRVEADAYASSDRIDCKRYVPKPEEKE